MVVIHKNWQALPVTATTVTTPIIEDHSWPAPVSSYMPPPDPIQRPTAHLSSEPDIVELNEIKHDEQNEPGASTYLYSSGPPPVQPKKRLRIIEQRGLLDQFFQLFITDGRRGCDHWPGLNHVSRQRHRSSKTRTRLTKWFLLRQPQPPHIKNIVGDQLCLPSYIVGKVDHTPRHETRADTLSELRTAQMTSSDPI